MYYMMCENIPTPIAYIPFKEDTQKVYKSGVSINPRTVNMLPNGISDSATLCEWVESAIKKNRDMVGGTIGGFVVALGNNYWLKRED